ncbi:MAG: ATP-grasp domain-containing protein [Chlamydiota bacterium]
MIVDAYSSASYFPKAFEKKGYDCVHIQSSDEVLKVFEESFHINEFVANYIYRGDLEEITRSLKNYSVLCVIAGCECGVELADAISESLNLKSNGTRLSEARRNKHKMAEALKAASLPTPKNFKTASWSKLMDWKREESVDYPIVLKPLKSAGSDSVRICKNESELKDAFYNIAGKRNILGLVNDEVFAQSFLKGSEFIVNSVSMNGKMYVVAILKGKKIFLEGIGYIYDREIMMKRRGDKQDALISMHEKVINALNINHGPAHGEYMLTDDGPVMIEVAARIAGGVNPKGNDESVGYNQMDLTVDSYVDEKHFELMTKKDYELKKQFYDIELNALCEGIVGDTEGFLQKISQLPSYSSAHLKVSTGSKVSKTIDLVSSLCNVILVHDDKTVIKKDYEELLSFSKELVR